MPTNGSGSLEVTVGMVERNIPIFRENLDAEIHSLRSQILGQIGVLDATISLLRRELLERIDALESRLN